MADTIKALKAAKKTLPQGTLENYAAECNAKVIEFDEDKKKCGLTEGEMQEATKLMASQGEINDPNSR